MKRVFHLLGFFVAAVLIGYFVYFMGDTFDSQALATLANPAVIIAVMVAVVLYGLIFPVSSWAWKKLLANDPMQWSVPELCGIMGVTQVAKYLPGNVAQHASRFALALARGMRADVFAMTVIVETMLAIAAAVLVAICLIAIRPAGLSLLPDELKKHLLWIALTIPAVLLLLPISMKMASRFTVKFVARTGYTIRAEAMPGRRSQVQALAAYAVNYLLIGLGFLIVARATGVSDAIGYAALTAAFSLSWIAGFLAPGVPAGLGVREGVMAMMLAGGSSDSGLLSAIMAMRIATIAGDLVWFLLGSLMLNAVKRRALE